MDRWVEHVGVMCRVRGRGGWGVGRQMEWYVWWRWGGSVSIQSKKCRSPSECGGWVSIASLKTYSGKSSNTFHILISDVAHLCMGMERGEQRKGRGRKGEGLESRRGIGGRKQRKEPGKK